MKNPSLYLTTYFDGLEENWLIYASQKDDIEKAEQVFKKLFYRGYGVKFNDEITGTSEIKLVPSIGKSDYKIFLKST